MRPSTGTRTLDRALDQQAERPSRHSLTRLRPVGTELNDFQITFGMVDDVYDPTYCSVAEKGRWCTATASTSTPCSARTRSRNPARPRPRPSPTRV